MQLGLDPRQLLQPPQEPPDASGVPALALGCCNVAIVEQVGSMAILPPISRAAGATLAANSAAFAILAAVALRVLVPGLSLGLPSFARRA